MLNQLILRLSKTCVGKLRVSSAALISTKYRRLQRMQDDYVLINSVPTHIYTWGKWIEEKKVEKPKELVLIITGNPGLPGFYTKFSASLYDELDKETPIWVIGHAGHDEPSKVRQDLVTPPLKGNEHLYDLQGQLNHKIDFIEKFVPKDTKIHLIGHSVGAKICLDLLKVLPHFSEQVVQCYLMFPTIEHIADSTKGRNVPSFNRIFFLCRIFYNLFHLLPQSWKIPVVKYFMRRDGMDVDEFLVPSLEYTNPRVIDRIWFMALDEMQKILDLDEEHVKSNVHRLKLYYAVKDDWVNTKFYYQIVERIPGINAELCSRGFEHAFVLKSGPESAKMVGEWINEFRKKQ